MCANVSKVGQGQPKLFWCKTSIKATNLPNMKSLTNEPTLWRQLKYSELARSSQKLGATFARLYLENG